MHIGYNAVLNHPVSLDGMSVVIDAYDATRAAKSVGKKCVLRATCSVEDHFAGKIDLNFIHYER